MPQKTSVNFLKFSDQNMEAFQVFIKTEEEMEDVSMHHTQSRPEDAPSTEPVKSERYLGLITYLFELNLRIF
jgi:hypothetical protein